MIASHHPLHHPFDHATFRKSSYSATGDCVEVAVLDGGAGVRDSKNRHGDLLVFGSPGWSAFLRWATSDTMTTPS